MGLLSQPNHMLFVCTGNTCRSPMAEYLFRERLGPDTDWAVTSAGVMASDGQTPSAGSVVALDELGIDLLPHRSSLLTEDRVDDASMIVVMTAAHMQMTVSAFPDAEGKIWLLNSFSEGVRFQDVSDPIGRPIGSLTS